MKEDRTDTAPMGQATAQASQAAYAVAAAVKGGGTAAGAAAGTALGGPLGMAVVALTSSRTFWKVVSGIFAAIFLWMFLIVNMIGIILTYLGFADADSFVNEAQSAEISDIKARIGDILENEDYEQELQELIRQARDENLREIHADKEANYAEYELTVIDEYETKLKRNMSYYLAMLASGSWDRSSLNSFLGYPTDWGDMSTDLTSQYDRYFEEASQTYGVPAALLKAVGMTESGFNQNAVSYVGAVGIMQLMPGTAASLGVNPYDARENILGGAKYIANNLQQFQAYSNGLELAIAAYNAGPGNVISYGYQIPPFKETQDYVKKVLGYLTIQEQKPEAPPDTGETEEDLSGPYGQLKELVMENADRIFSWAVTGEREADQIKTVYYQLSDSGKTEVEKDVYEQLKADGERVAADTFPAKVRTVEYTLALLLNARQITGGGYGYKYVTSQSTFELMLQVLKRMSEGIGSLKDSFFSLFSWSDFVTGGGTDSYIGNIDATGDLIAYDTVGKGVKKVVYFNQGEEPWGSLPYGDSTIGAAGCGPTSLAIVISMLTGQTVNPQTTAAFAINNGEYVSGAGTAHSFPTNAARHWGLTCERVGKDRMDEVVQALKDGKMVVEICEAYTITGGSDGHFIVLTGVTRDGYITIADCASRERTAKVYSVDTIRSYGRDLSDGAFWIIGK